MPAAQVLDLQDALLEDRLGEVFAGVALGTSQGFDDVAERELADLQLSRPTRRRRPGPACRCSSGSRSLSRTTSGAKPELLEELDRDRVALGVDPGAVERVLAVGDLEEARRLREGRRPDPLDLRQLVAAGERAVLLAIIDDPPGGQLVEARDVPQQGHARRVQVDADEVDATGDDRLERLLELLGVDVVLVEPDADVLGLDLDQLGQRVLEPAADRDAAAQGRVEVGKLVAADLAGRVDARAGLVDDDVGKLGEQRVGRVRPAEAPAAAAGDVPGPRGP